MEKSERLCQFQYTDTHVHAHCVSSRIHSSMDTWTSATSCMENNADINMRAQVSLWHSDFISIRCVSRSGIAEGYGNSIFNCSRDIHTVFHNRLKLVDIPNSTTAPIPLHPWQLTHVNHGLSGSHSNRWSDLMVLICISLIISDDKHLFMYLLAICISSGKLSLRVFCPAFNCVFFAIGLYEVFIYWILTH